MVTLSSMDDPMETVASSAVVVDEVLLYHLHGDRERLIASSATSVMACS